MFGSGSTITVSVKGGTVYNVYGGGFRALVGKSNAPIDSITVNITGGTILGDVYGGGSGGFDKILHLYNSNYDNCGINSRSWQNSTGKSQVYANDIVVNVTDAHVCGSVYGGGKSVPAFSYYHNKGSITSSTEDDFRAPNEDVASVYCKNLSINLIGSAVVDHDVYGGGRGIKLSSSTTVTGANDARNSEYAYMIVVYPSGEGGFLPWFGPDNFSFAYQNSTSANNTYAGFTKVNSTNGIRTLTHDNSGIRNN